MQHGWSEQAKSKFDNKKRKKRVAVHSSEKQRNKRERKLKMSWRAKTKCWDCRRGLEYIQRVFEVSQKRTFPLEVVALVGDFAAKETWVVGKKTTERKRSENDENWRVYVKIRRTNFVSTYVSIVCQDIMEGHGEERTWWRCEECNGFQQTASYAIDLSGCVRSREHDPILLGVFVIGKKLKEEQERLGSRGIEYLEYFGEADDIQKTPIDGKYICRDRRTVASRDDRLAVTRYDEDEKVDMRYNPHEVNVRSDIWNFFDVACIIEVERFETDEETFSKEEEFQKMAEVCAARPFWRCLCAEYYVVPVPEEKKEELKKMEMWEFEILKERKMKRLHDAKVRCMRVVRV